MVARLFYGSPIDDEVNRLTAEDVPNHELDMSAALNFADKIRSKEYSAKEVTRVLRKRLDSSNPNVQILVLSLADICVKNGGTLIQLEISAREFIDEVTNLLESKTGRDFELRQLVLRLIQEWAALFRGNNEMGYANGVLERMKRTGYTFPKLAMVASGAMADTASAPEWEDSPVCQRCRTTFTFTNRKHHCRHCGKCYCNDCSSNNTPIPKFAIYDPVRVCHGCYLRLKKIVPDTDSLPSTSLGTQAQTSSARPAAASGTAAFSAPDVNDDDEDLKRAIELSLQESQSRPNYADYTLPPKSSATAQYSAPAPAPAPVTTAQASATRYPVVSNEPFPLTSATGNDLEDEDDPDLLAAIEASLREIPANSVPDYLTVSTNIGYPTQAQAPTHEEYEDNAALSAFMPSVNVGEDESGPLTTTEWENVQLFEALLLRIRDSGQDIRNDPQIQYLHESIDQLHPKISDAIDGVDNKHKEFSKLLDRIVTAIRIYDQLLDKRLRSNTYRSVGPSAQSVPSYLPTPQSMYPAVPAQQAAYATAAQPIYQSVAGAHYTQQAPPAAPTAYPQQTDQRPQSVFSELQQQTQQPLPPPQQQQLGPAYLQHPTSTQMLHAPSPSIVTPAQKFQHISTPAAAMHQASELSHSPPTNPYFVPPPVSHVPSFPVLQPLSKPASVTPVQQAPVAAPATASTVVAASAPEPEEALLIEF
ncbi:Vacuolar protein-sorting-associated protein 27 [Coemansia aciculifera]|uniref:Vacuolar protein sorting-associated protein 27 n=1 Tax=Coemansia aciculifera TaxID=417176 RepID=A0A9W8IV16_9FUNG|nr:Vacuolar protein-sorting-associated protein 27 [Coemansia aciculifera]